jgi:hypothetical protein
MSVHGQYISGQGGRMEVGGYCRVLRAGSTLAVDLGVPWAAQVQGCSMCARRSMVGPARMFSCGMSFECFQSAFRVQVCCCATGDVCKAPEVF